MRRRIRVLLFVLLLLSATVIGRAEAFSQSDVLNAAIVLSSEGTDGAEEAAYVLRLTNLSDEMLTDLVISAPDGTMLRRVNALAARASEDLPLRSLLTGATAKEGSTTLTIVYSTLNARAQLSLPVTLQRTDAAPDAEFSRMISSRYADFKGKVTITYIVKNIGNVELTDLSVSDGAGDFLETCESLHVGETITFTQTADLSGAVVSEPTLHYGCRADDRIRIARLSPLAVTLAAPDLRTAFEIVSTDEKARTATVRLTLRNAGDCDYRNITISDALHGGVIDCGFDLPADGAAREITHVYPLSDVSRCQWSLKLHTEMGDSITTQTPLLALPQSEKQTFFFLTLEASPADADAREDALPWRDRQQEDLLYVRVRVQCSGADFARNVQLTENSLGQIYTFAAISKETPIERVFALPKTEATELVLRLEYTDASGQLHSVYADPIPVESLRAEAATGGADELLSMAPTAIGYGMFNTLLIVCYAVIAAMLVLLALRMFVVKRGKEKTKTRKEKAHKPSKDEKHV